jgi:hypothetical protein
MRLLELNHVRDLENVPPRETREDWGFEMTLYDVVAGAG